MSRPGLRTEKKGLALTPGIVCHSHIEETDVFLRLVITKYDDINVETFLQLKIFIIISQGPNRRQETLEY